MRTQCRISSSENCHRIPEATDASPVTCTPSGLACAGGSTAAGVLSTSCVVGCTVCNRGQLFADCLTPLQVTRPAAATGGCEGGERLAPSCTPAVGRGHAEAAERCGNANLTRRAALGLLLAAGGAVEGVVRPRLASALEAAAGGVADAGDELAAFTNPGQGYRLLRPATWEQVSSISASSLLPEVQELCSRTRAAPPGCDARSTRQAPTACFATPPARAPP